MERRQEKKRKVCGADVRALDKEWTVAGIESTAIGARECGRLRSVSATSHEAVVLPGKESEPEDAERQLKHLDVDMLAEVFSHLSQKERCEVMLVCKHWENAAGESSTLWKKVDMLWKRRWLTGGMIGGMTGGMTGGLTGGLTGGMMLRVLRGAQEIRIRPGCDNDQITVSAIRAGRGLVRIGYEYKLSGVF